MYKYFLATLLATLFASTSFAQHSDIEFGFEDNANPVFEVLLDEVTDEGIQVAEAEFFSLGPFTTTDSPGFITPEEEGEVLTVNPGDQVFIRVLDASAPDSPTARGVGYINFYVPGGDGLQTLEGSSGTFDITGNTPGSDSDSVSVFTGNQLVSGAAELFLAAGSNGNTMSDTPGDEPNITLGSGRIHTHLGFDLTGDLGSTDAAVGLLLQFTTIPADGSDPVESDPFFLIFNNGLDEEVFETDALAAFGLVEEEEVILGDINGDGVVDFGDIPAFIALLQAGEFLEAADINGDGEVNFADIPGFIEILQNA